MRDNLSWLYLDTVMSIIQSVDIKEWKKRRDSLLSMGAIESFVKEFCTITLRGFRGSGHTHFAMKMLDRDINCVVFTCNEVLKQNISEWSNCVVYNGKDEKDVTRALGSAPEVIIEDSVMVDNDIINKYIFNSNRPVFRVMVGHV